jgi:hypothetical protein
MPEIATEQKMGDTLKKMENEHIKANIFGYLFLLPMLIFGYMFFFPLIIPYKIRVKLFGGKNEF